MASYGDDVEVWFLRVRVCSVASYRVGNSAQIFSASRFLGHASPNVYVWRTLLLQGANVGTCGARNVCTGTEMYVFSSFVLLQRLSSKVAAKIRAS